MKSTAAAVPVTVQLGGLTLGTFLVALIALKTGSGDKSAHTSKRYDYEIKETLDTAIKWAKAAEQDSDPLTALTDITMALASARNARRMSTPDEIIRKYGVNIDELLKLMEALHFNIVERIVQTCPALQQHVDGVFAINTTSPAV
jgi:hypothetical protein